MDDIANPKQFGARQLKSGNNPVSGVRSFSSASSAACQQFSFNVLYIRNTPNLVSGMGALRQAESASDNTRRVSAGGVVAASPQPAGGGGGVAPAFFFLGGGALEG